MGLAYGLDCGDVPNEHIIHIKNCLPAALRDYVDQIIEGLKFYKKNFMYKNFL